MGNKCKSMSEGLSYYFYITLIALMAMWAILVTHEIKDTTRELAIASIAYTNRSIFMLKGVDINSIENSIEAIKTVSSDDSNRTILYDWQIVNERDGKCDIVLDVRTYKIK